MILLSLNFSWIFILNPSIIYEFQLICFLILHFTDICKLHTFLLTFVNYILAILEIILLEHQSSHLLILLEHQSSHLLILLEHQSSHLLILLEHQIGTDCIGSCKPDYHTIMATPHQFT
jgi:hypothetical protein